MSSSVRNIVLVVFSALVACALIGAAVVVKNSGGDDSARTESTTSPPPMLTLSVAELAQHDGKDGRDCFVAVDGNVYEIPQGVRWQNGQHLPSEGLAYCGADLSAVIGKSPHGKAKLLTLDRVGTLAS